MCIRDSFFIEKKSCKKKIFYNIKKNLIKVINFFDKNFQIFINVFYHNFSSLNVTKNVIKILGSTQAMRTNA